MSHNPRHVNAQIERVINDVITEFIEEHANPKPIPVAKEPARIGKRPKGGEQ